MVSSHLVEHHTETILVHSPHEEASKGGKHWVNNMRNGKGFKNLGDLGICFRIYFLLAFAWFGWVVKIACFLCCSFQGGCFV